MDDVTLIYAVTVDLRCQLYGWLLLICWWPLRCYCALPTLIPRLIPLIYLLVIWLLFIATFVTVVTAANYVPRYGFAPLFVDLILPTRRVACGWFVTSLRSGPRWLYLTVHLLPVPTNRLHCLRVCRGCLCYIARIGIPRTFPVVGHYYGVTCPHHALGYHGVDLVTVDLRLRLDYLYTVGLDLDTVGWLFTALTGGAISRQRLLRIYCPTHLIDSPAVIPHSPVDFDFTLLIYLNSRWLLIVRGCRCYPDSQRLLLNYDCPEPRPHEFPVYVTGRWTLITLRCC